MINFTLCTVLFAFNPIDVFQIFDYERLVRILLFIVSEHTAPENAFVQRAGIYLLNSLACHVNTEQKLLVGNLGAMEKMLGLISHRVSEGRRRTHFSGVAKVDFLLGIRPKQLRWRPHPDRSRKA